METTFTVTVEKKKPKTVITQLEVICMEFCTNYCKYSEAAKEALDEDIECEQCKKCPLHSIY